MVVEVKCNNHTRWICMTLSRLQINHYIKLHRFKLHHYNRGGDDPYNFRDHYMKYITWIS